MKSRNLIFALVSACACAYAGAADLTASFGGNEIRLYTNPLAYEVAKDGAIVVARTPIGVSLDGKSLEKGAKLVAKSTGSESGTIAVPVYKKASVDGECKWSLADFDDFAVRLVARKDGVAYRIELKKPGVIGSERADVTVPKAARCWFNRTGRGSLGCEETVPEFADASYITGQIISVNGGMIG